MVSHFLALEAGERPLWGRREISYIGHPIHLLFVFLVQSGAWLAGPEAWLAGPEDWLALLDGRTDFRDFFPFYRTLSPIGAAAQNLL